MTYSAWLFHLEREEQARARMAELDALLREQPAPTPEPTPQPERKPVDRAALLQWWRQYYAKHRTDISIRRNGRLPRRAYRPRGAQRNQGMWPDRRRQYLVETGREEQAREEGLIA